MTKGYKRLLLVAGQGLPALGLVLVAVGTPDALEAVDGVVGYGKHGAELELAAADLDGGHRSGQHGEGQELMWSGCACLHSCKL